MRRLSLGVLGVLGVFVATWLTALPVLAVEVIAHPGVMVSQLSQASARAIFGLRQPRWPDGSAVRVFVLPDTHPVHRALSQEVLNVFPYQLRQTWDRLVFSGLAQGPQAVANEAEMLARVARTPGAIGYVGAATNHPGIKVLHVD